MGFIVLMLISVLLSQKICAFYILQHLIPSNNFGFSQNFCASITIPVVQQFLLSFSLREDSSFSYLAGCSETDFVPDLTEYLLYSK